MPKYRSNKHRILQALQDAFIETNQELHEAIQNTFDLDIWDWPNETRRSSGQVVGSPRNVIDTGELKASQSMTVLGGQTVSFTWNAEHALKTFLGYTTPSGDVHPARNVPEETLKAFAFKEKFAARARAKLSGVQ